MLAAQRQLRARGQALDAEAVDRRLNLVQRRYFDDGRSPGRKALDDALAAIVRSHDRAPSRVGVSLDEREALMGVMRRFLRVRTTLVRCFPLAEFETVAPSDAVRRVLEHADSSGVSWRQKFNGFLEFLTDRCSGVERTLYLDAAHRTQTRGIRVDADEAASGDGDASAVTLGERSSRHRRDKPGDSVTTDAGVQYTLLS